MLVGGVIDDKLGDYLQAAPMRFRDEGLKVIHRSVGGVDRLEFGDVVAVVAQWRRIERKYPDGGGAQFLHVVEPAHEPGEIAYPVIVGVLEGLDVKLVD